MTKTPETISAASGQPEGNNQRWLSVAIQPELHGCSGRRALAECPLGFGGRGWAGTSEPIWQSFLSGVVVQGAVEDGDRLAGEVDPVAVDGGMDQACAVGGLQACEAVAAEAV
jgi:hypothetical protein